VIAIIGRGVALWKVLYGHVKVHEYWQEILGEVPEGAWVRVAESDYWGTIPSFDPTPYTFYHAQTTFFDPSDDAFYLCIAPSPGYTTGEDPLYPSEDPEHWRKLRRGFSPALFPITTTPYFNVRVMPDEIVEVWVAPEVGCRFVFLPPSYPWVSGGAGPLVFTAYPQGLPPTGQTTSYHAGDDGDLRAGGGVLPVTGQTTSHHDGDDGDLQAGFKGE